MDYTEKGDFDEEIADLIKAINIKPNYAEVYYIRGLAYSDKKDFD